MPTGKYIRTKEYRKIMSKAMKGIKKIIKQVLYNPQVSYPPISYLITDRGANKSYTSKYIDKKDFELFLKRLEKRLIYRLTKSNKV